MDDVYEMNFIDTFIFNDELPMLEFRLNFLAPYVKAFFLVESTHTFSGQEKPILSDFNPPFLKEFKSRLFTHTLRGAYPTVTTWAREIRQRNAISVHNMSVFLDTKDIILISDLDEFPDIDFLTADSTEVCLYLPFVFAQKFYYYTVNMLHRDPFLGTIVLTVEDLKRISAHTWRNDRHTKLTAITGGWHFSYFGGVDKIIKKVQEFSHQEFNTPYFINKERLLKCLREGTDLFDRTFEDWTVNKDYNSLPQYLLDNKDKYGWFFNT